MSNNAPKTPPPFSAAMPGRDTINNLQVTTLLNMLNTFMVFLTNARLDARAAREDDAKVSIADGGAVLAAEQSFVKLCNRVDEITADSARWSMDAQTDLEASLLNVHDEQRKYLQYQQGRLALATSPHARFYPTLAKLEDGRWAAIYGDPSTSQSIIGLGDNPEAALADFDEIFDGRHNQKHEQKHNEKQTVDASGRQVPPAKPKLTDSPAFGRRIRANRTSSLDAPIQSQIPPGRDDGSAVKRAPKRKRTR